MQSSTANNNKDTIAVRNSLIPDHLVDLIRHWSQWISPKQLRCFLIVDSYDAGSTINPTETDFIWLLEQGVRNPDGSRKFIKVETEKFVEQITTGALEYFDPVTFLKSNSQKT